MILVKANIARVVDQKILNVFHYSHTYPLLYTAGSWSCFWDSPKYYSELIAEENQILHGQVIYSFMHAHIYPLYLNIMRWIIIARLVHDLKFEIISFVLNCNLASHYFGLKDNN